MNGAMLPKVGLLFGPPAAGKTAVCDLLENELGVACVSIGSMLYDIAFGNHDDHRESVVRKHILSGIPCPSEVTLDLLCEHLDSIHGEDVIIVDGLPRKVSEIPAVLNLLYLRGVKKSSIMVLELSASKENIIKRSILRGRKDDGKIQIENRLKQYNNFVAKTIEKLLSRNITYQKIFADGDLEFTYKQVLFAMEIDEIRKK